MPISSSVNINQNRPTQDHVPNRNLAGFNYEAAQVDTAGSYNANRQLVSQLGGVEQKAEDASSTADSNTAQIAVLSAEIDSQKLKVSDGATTAFPVNEIDVVGGSVTDLGGGKVEITVTGGGGGASMPYPVGGVPALSSFTIINPLTFTRVANADGSIRLEMTAAAVGALVIAAPTPPYQLTIGTLYSNQNNANNLSGIVHLDSSTGKYTGLMQSWPNAHTYYFIHSNGTVGQEDAIMLNNPHPNGNVTFFRATDDGTNRKYYMSGDGKFFMLIGSEASSTYITPDRVGIGFNMYNGSMPFSTTLFYWDLQ